MKQVKGLVGRKVSMSGGKGGRPVVVTAAQKKIATAMDSLQQEVGLLKTLRHKNIVSYLGELVPSRLF